jgi:uncharacterized protein
LSGGARVFYFKPQGVPLRFLEEVLLEADEFEAIMLYDYQGLNQIEAAGRMHVSQPTFARILSRANKKVAQAIVEGKAIRIEGVSDV